MPIKIEAAFRLVADRALMDRGSAFVESLGFKVLNKDSDRRLIRDNDLPYEVEVADAAEAVARVTSRLQVEPKRTFSPIVGNTWSWFISPKRYVTLTTYVSRTGIPAWIVHVVDTEYGMPYRPTTNQPKGPARVGYRK